MSARDQAEAQLREAAGERIAAHGHDVVAAIAATPGLGAQEASVTAAEVGDALMRLGERLVIRWMWDDQDPAGTLASAVDLLDPTGVSVVWSEVLRVRWPVADEAAALLAELTAPVPDNLRELFGPDTGTQGPEGGSS